jgi:glycosyltransferase involved in cell wall biosynthesis
MISVVIPVYNSERTIRETIRSVLAQTFTDFELIIINDGSPDRSLEVIREISDPRIKIFSYENAGLVNSRNRGLELAKGEYIAFLDHDDLWTPDKLQEQFNALQNNPSAVVAYSWITYIDESDRVLRSGLRVNVNKDGDTLSRLLLMNFLETGSNPLLVTQAVREVGGFDRSTEPSDDWDLFLRLAVKYPFVCVPFPHILYRQLTTSLSTNIERMEKAGLKVIQKAAESIPEFLPASRDRTLANFYLYLSLKSLEGHPNPRKSLKALRLLTRCVRYQPSVFSQRQRLTQIALVKSFLGLFLPEKLYDYLLEKLKKSNG